MNILTVEFRDGERDVPEYFVRLLSASSIDFHAVTFEEARDLLNHAMERQYLNNFQEQLIAEHFVRNGRWE